MTFNPYEPPREFETPELGARKVQEPLPRAHHVRLFMATLIGLVFGLVVGSIAFPPPSFGMGGGTFSELSMIAAVICGIIAYKTEELRLGIRHDSRIQRPDFGGEFLPLMAWRLGRLVRKTILLRKRPKR